MSRMIHISQLIAELQSIHERFGDTCCWVSGLSWGSVALWQEAHANDKDDPLKPEWMWEAGWRSHPKAKHFWHHPQIPTARWDDRENELMIGSDDMGWILVKRGATRGLVRTLTELLGIPPKGRS